MDKQIRHFQVLIAASAVMLVGVGCHSGQKPPAHLLPPAHSAPPPIQQAQTAKPAVNPSLGSNKPATQAKASAPAQSQPEVKSDPVAELLARVEKEYQSG